MVETEEEGKVQRRGGGNKGRIKRGKGTIEDGKRGSGKEEKGE